MSDVAISVRGLSKRYRLGLRRGRAHGLRDRLSESVRRPLERIGAALQGQSRAPSEQWIWALRDVSFEVASGEVVAVVGGNGAGKSTLLKILSRITEPSEGRAEIRGRVGSLLEVGTGFHPDLTGRENVYLNGAIIGMRRAEIDRKFDEIVAFSEVERFLDTQVKHYSSGMYLRLAFAVAAHLEPEILLMDEVLAVGDASFQRKCLGKVSDISRAGRAVLFVSHNMEAVLRLCSRAIWLAGGLIVQDGPVREVVTAYLSAASERLAATFRAPVEAKAAPILLRAADLVDDRGQPVRQIEVGQPFTIRTEWEGLAAAPGAYCFLRVWDAQGRMLFGVNHEVPKSSGEASHVVACRVSQNVLPPGQHRVSVGCYRPPSTILHVVEDCLGFAVAEVSFAERGSGFSPNSLFVPAVEWRFAAATGESL